jgi:hypothetical protein
MAETNNGKQEKPYSKPTLTVYGKVVDMTKTNATVGGQDNPTNPRLFTGM